MTLRAVLPSGGTLSQQAWAQRHRWVLVVLWVGLAATVSCLSVVGLALDVDPWVVYFFTGVIVVVGVVASMPWRRLSPRASRTLRSCTASYGVTATACYVVGLTHGAPEAHLLFFVLVPFIALYEAWPPFVVAVGLVLVENGVVGTVLPVAVFGDLDSAGVWTRAGVHSGLFGLAALGSLLAWRSAELARERAAAALAQLQHRTRHDELTGLVSRSGLNELLVEALRRPAAGGAPVPLAVLVTDLDRFKDVNDTLGHTAGDDLLRSVAGVMSQTVGATTGGALARLGGDEFALLLPGADAETAVAVAELLRENVREHALVMGVALDVELSAGVAVHEGPVPADDAAAAQVAVELMRHADIAMYAAKSGGDGVVTYDPSLDHHSTARLEVARELRRAVHVTDDELLLHFQPKVDLGSASGDGESALRLVGVEALVRWQHPTRGFMPPNDFIPVLGSTDLVHAFTTRMVDLALDQARAWLDDGFCVPVAVNVFPRCLTHPGFVAQVAGSLQARALLPSLLRLEITEDALVADPVAAAAVITELTAMGVSTSIDDFGTGYSSLSYLRGLPVDEVKLDRSFVTGLGAQAGEDEGGLAPADEVLAASIIGLAHRLGMKVVAEGVETPAEHAVLHSLGCDVGQGYLFARPAPAAALSVELLQTARTDDGLLTLRGEPLAL